MRDMMLAGIFMMAQVSSQTGAPPWQEWHVFTVMENLLSFIKMFNHAYSPPTPLFSLSLSLFFSLTHVHTPGDFLGLSHCWNCTWDVLAYVTELNS